MNRERIEQIIQDKCFSQDNELCNTEEAADQILAELAKEKEPQIVIWDKCELHHEPGDYEGGYGDEWWIESDSGEFQTGLSVIGWPSSDFFPNEGKLVFIPKPGLTEKAMEAIKKDDEYWEEEGKKLGTMSDNNGDGVHDSTMYTPREQGIGIDTTKGKACLKTNLIPEGE